MSAQRDSQAAERTLQKGARAPPLNVLEKYAFYLSKRKNRAGEPIIAGTINEYIKHFSSAFFQATGTTIDDATRTSLFHDLALHAYLDDEGRRGYIMETTERYLKGNEDPETNWFRFTVTSQDRLYRDPVAFFLAFALADGAFHNITTVEQFLNVRIPADKKSLQFRWRQDKLDTPIFQEVKQTGPTSNSWNSSSMFYYLAKATKSAGYKKGAIAIHTLRRGLANVVDPIVSPAERNKLLGWASSDMYQKHYISRISSVDGQAAFHKDAPRTKHIKLLRSACRDRNSAIPEKLSARAALELSQSSEMFAISEELAKLPKASSQERRRLYESRRSLVEGAVKKFQDQWLEEDYNSTVSMAVDTCASGNTSTASEQDFQKLGPFIPDRWYIASLAGIHLDPGSTEQSSAYRALASLCVEDHQVYYRPDEAPIAGRCPHATSTHLAQWPLVCPHPMCQAVVLHLDSFNHHMVDIHRKATALEQKPVKKRKIITSDNVIKQAKSPVPGLYNFKLETGSQSKLEPCYPA
ncbi:MAG: hypothetical protein Q9216_003222 [Gyalolechia sp. 2 TL-2023]